MPINFKRPVIRYNNISLLKSTSPSFSIDSNSGDNVSFLSNVNDLSFNFSIPEAKEDVISSRATLNHFFKPGAEIKIDINKNENFIDLFPQYFGTGGLTGNLDEDFNLYGIISDEMQNDSISSNLTGFDMISFGNCKLDSFSMSQQVNRMIESNYSFTAYNVKAERVVGENSAFSGELPCLNLTGDQTNIVSGLALTYHFTGLEEKYQKSTTGSSVFPSHNTKILISGLSKTETFMIEADSIQSFNFNVDVPTKQIFTIGKKHPIKRKALFPSEGSFSLNNKISTFRVNRDESYEDFSSERDLKKYLETQVFYSIKIDMTNTTGKSVSLEIPSGRLESQSYSASVGSDFECNMEFAFDLFGMNNSI